MGRAASGTASVSRAAQTWNGIAPNRMATAESERQVGEAEHDRLCGQLAQVAPDPRGRGDRHRPGEDERAQGSRTPAVAPIRPPVGARVRSTPPQPAGGRGQHGDTRVRQGQGEAASAQGAEHHGRGIAARPGGQPDDRERQPDQRSQDQEEPDVVGRGE